MKKMRILALLCFLFLLTGCTTPVAPTEPSTPPETIAPSADTALETVTVPQPTGGSFHHPMVKPSPEARCAATSFGQIAETEDGYYVTVETSLYYAEKRDLQNWILVCNKPDCKHRLTDDCPAIVSYGVWESGGMIYTTAPLCNGAGDVILCSAGDGSGWSPALSDMDSPFRITSGIYAGYQGYDGGMCFNISQMKENGFWDNYLYFIDKNGTHKYIYGEDYADGALCGPGSISNGARGDLTMLLALTDPGAVVGESITANAGTELYRVSPEAIEKLELPEGCSYFGAYLSGDTMIHYHPNDGFYKLDYYGGTEEKIADAAYTDGFGYCMDGEFLIETTLSYQQTAKECKFRYFDGTDWTEVPLPEEFTPETNLRIVALSSDTLFLEELSIALYMVKLGDNQMVKCMDYPPPTAS